MKIYTTARLVKSEDLNHHGTLYAGRTAEWFVESSFIAAATAVGNPENIVCLKIHGLVFKNPVQKGDIVTFKARVAHLGSTSLTVHCRIYSETRSISPIEGFITFINVDENGNKVPHGLVLDETVDEDEIEIRKSAQRAINCK